MTKKGIIALLSCMIALCLALASCGEGNYREKYIGTWKLVEMEQNDGTVTTQEQIDQLINVGFEVYVNLHEDGTLVLSMFGTPIEGTWEAENGSGGTITLEESDTVEMKLENDRLTFKQNDSSLTFEKTDDRDDPTGSTGEDESSEATEATDETIAGTDEEAEATAEAEAAEGEAAEEGEATGEAAEAEGTEAAEGAAESTESSSSSEG